MSNKAIILDANILIRAKGGEAGANSLLGRRRRSI